MSKREFFGIVCSVFIVFGLAAQYIVQKPDGTTQVYETYSDFNQGFDGIGQVYMVNRLEDGIQAEGPELWSIVKRFATTDPNGELVWSDVRIIEVYETREIALSMRDRFEASPEIMLESLNHYDYQRLKRIYPERSIVMMLPSRADVERRSKLQIP